MIKMPTLAFAAAVALTLGGFAHAQVFKCTDAAGKVTYSQAPCIGAGQLLDSRRPSAAPPAELTQRREVERALRGPAGASPEASDPAAPRRAQCMDEQEVRNLQAGGTSIRLDPLDRQVQAEQVRRARNCEPLMSEVEMQAMKENLRAQRRASRPPPPTTITNCDTAGCWGSDGSRYNGTGGGNFVRQDGAVCVRNGNTLNCN